MLNGASIASNATMNVSRNRGCADMRLSSVGMGIKQHCFGVLEWNTEFAENAEGAEKPD